MATLQTAIEQQSEGIWRAIRELDAEVARLDTEQAESVRLADDARDTAARQQENLRFRRLARKHCEDEVEQLRKQIDDLERILSERRADLETASAAVSETEGRISELRKIERQHQGLLGERRLRIAELRRLRAEHDGRLRQARLAGVAAYHDELWRRLLVASEGQETLRRRHEARQRLQNACTSDDDVAALVKSAEEWRQILGSAASQMVKETANQQLARITQELETRYPGAMEAPPEERENSELEELFVIRGRGGCPELILPVPRPVWDAMANGGATAGEDLAARLVWAVGSTLGLAHDNCALAPDDFGCRLKVPEERLESARNDGIRLAMQADGSVLFLVSQVPQDVQEAIGHEDSDI